MKKITLEIHPGYWYLIPGKQSNGHTYLKGWIKDYQSATIARKKFSFLCLTLNLEKEVKAEEYTGQFENLSK